MRWSLHPATASPYFYECFFKLCQQPIPYGDDYPAWRRRIMRRMREGKEIWYLGEYAVYEPLAGWDAGEDSGPETRRSQWRS